MPIRSKVAAILAPCLTLSLAACTPEAKLVGTDVETGAMLFATNCAACHGADGRGAGPASLGLGETPPDLRRLTRQNRGRFPRTYVMEIMAGKVGPDHPTAAMPEFGPEHLGRLVTLQSDGKEVTVPAGMLAVANYLESIQE